MDGNLLKKLNEADLFQPADDAEVARRAEIAKPKSVVFDTEFYHIEIKESSDKQGVIIDVWTVGGEELIDTYTYWNDDYEVTPGEDNQTVQ